MKILFNSKILNFGEHSEPYRYKYGGNTIDVYLDAGGHLMQTHETDQFGKYSEKIEFDEQNNIIEYHRYDYANKDKSEYTEYYKGRNIEYTRKAYIKKIKGLIHHIEEYTSKTNPSANYINEYIRDASGKLLKAIHNGNAYFIAKQVCRNNVV